MQQRFEVPSKTGKEPGVPLPAVKKSWRNLQLDAAKVQSERLNSRCGRRPPWLARLGAESWRQGLFGARGTQASNQRVHIQKRSEKCILAPPRSALGDLLAPFRPATGTGAGCLKSSVFP